MRSAGTSHPEWGYLAHTSGVLPAVRIALVATVIGATGSAAVVVSLIERPGANEGNTIAAHALVTGAPAVPAVPSPLTTGTLAHGPAQPKPAATGGVASAATAPAPTASTDAYSPKADRPISPTPNVPISAEIPRKAEVTEAIGEVPADAAPVIAPVGKHQTARHRRYRRPRRVFGEFGGRGYGRFGSMHGDW